MVVHCCHNDTAGGVRPGSYLGEEAQLGEQCHPSAGEPEVGRLTAQRVHLRRSVSGGDGKQEDSYPGQVLEWAGQYGFEEGFGQSRQNQLQTPHGCNHAGNALGVFKTFNLSLKRRVHANWDAVDHCMPTRDSCHISLYDVLTASLSDLV